MKRQGYHLLYHLQKGLEKGTSRGSSANNIECSLSTNDFLSTVSAEPSLDTPSHIKVSFQWKDQTTTSSQNWQRLVLSGANLLWYQESGDYQGPNGRSTGPPPPGQAGNSSGDAPDGTVGMNGGNAAQTQAADQHDATNSGQTATTTQTLAEKNVVQEPNAFFLLPMRFGVDLAIRPEVRLWRLPDAMPTRPTTNVALTMVPVGIVTDGPKVGQTAYVRVNLNADSQTLVANGKAVRTRQVWFHRAEKPSERAKIIEEVIAAHKAWKRKAMRVYKFDFLAWQVREMAREVTALYDLHRRDTVDWTNPEVDDVLDDHKPAQFLRRVLMGRLAVPAATVKPRTKPATRRKRQTFCAQMRVRVGRLVARVSLAILDSLCCTARPRGGVVHSGLSTRVPC